MRRPIIKTPRHSEAFSIEARAGAQQAPAAQLRWQPDVAQAIFRALQRLCADQGADCE
jgi:hypothetical protein